MWEHLAVAKTLWEQGSCSDAPATWRTALLLPGMLVAKKTSPKDFFFCVYGGTCATVLWPAAEHADMKRKGLGFKALRSCSDLRMSVVVDVADWIVMEYANPTPLRMFVLNGNKMPLGTSVLLAIQDCKAPVPLLHYHARRGFVDVPAPVLTKLCRVELEIPCTAMTYAEKVHQAIQKVLGVSEAKVGW